MTPHEKSLGLIYFRPHHFMCTNGFEGKGYSPTFVENFSAISDRLKNKGGDDVLIQIVETTDDICRPCPHRQGSLCEKQAFIADLDQRHLKALKLSIGQVVSWGEAKKRIVDYISDEAFSPLCRGCEWQDMGICIKALRRLRQGHKQDKA